VSFDAGYSLPDRGGVHAGTVKRCAFFDNYAQNNSSAIRGSYAHHCLIAKSRTSGTSASGGGSAVGFGWAFNCTLADNAERDGYHASFYNCILTGKATGGYLYDNCVSGGTEIPVTNVNTFTDAPFLVNPAAGDYRLAAGSPCIDRANHAYVDNRFGTDLAGEMRMQNARVDLGAYEYDWRPAFAAALDGAGMTVSEITPFVTYVTNAAYTAGSAVYLDGHAAQTNGQSTVGMTAPWYLPVGRTVKLHCTVTGNGTLALYEGETMIGTATSADGDVELKVRTAAQNPCPLRFVYTPGTGDTGGALLDTFENTGGILMMLR